MENNQLQKVSESELIQKLVLQGDIGGMNASQKVDYYNRFCQSLGLNPLTQPFQIIKFQGKEKLYATKDCTEQLRKIHGVSITEVSSQQLQGIFVVTAKAQDKTGKTDAATGAVTIEGLKGDMLANALMKAETKAKRRVTLSICGLGILDESELETMPAHATQSFEEIPTIEEKKLLISLAYKSTLDEDGRLKALESITNCMDYKMYEKIQMKLESLQMPIDQMTNPNQGDINKHLLTAVTV